MMVVTRPIRLLVCGNVERGDDGAALAAVTRLLPALPPHLLAGLDVRACEQLELEDLLELPVDTACVIVDAALGVVPGATVTLRLSEVPDRDARTGPVARSSHVLPIGQVVAMAQVMRGRPIDGSLVAIGGDSFGFGPGLGQAVRDGLPAFQTSIEAALIDAATEPSPHIV